MSQSRTYHSIGVLVSATAVAAVLLGGCGHGASSVAPTPGRQATQDDRSQIGFFSGPFGSSSPIAADGAPVCGEATGDRMRCLSWIRVDGSSQLGDASPDRIAGYHPADLQSAYALPSASRGAGQTIAVVLLADAPSVEPDLSTYRSAFGLSPCTTSNRCFKKVNQRGFRRNYPPPDPNWGVEASIDTDMISAVCPKCHILIVEADNVSSQNAAASVDEAVTLGADVVVLPFGGADWSTNSHYKHPGHILVASAGDGGYAGGTLFPAGSQYVVAAGGTRLRRAQNPRGWIETVWSHDTSGCGREPKPGWQTDRLCDRRTIADVAASADVFNGVSVFGTFGMNGWNVAGGTGVSASIIGGVYGLAANEGRLVYARGLYRFSNHLFDVTSGNDGSCGGTYLCTGSIGYDGPTGNGTPNGIGAF